MADPENQPAPEQDAGAQSQSDTGQDQTLPPGTVVRETVTREVQVEPAVYGEGEEAAPDTAANANADVEAPGGEDDPGSDASLDED